MFLHKKKEICSKFVLDSGIKFALKTENTMQQVRHRNRTNTQTCIVSGVYQKKCRDCLK